MKRTWTIIGVRDVPRSLQWYQSLFGRPASPPGHSYFGQLRDSDGTVLLCLHQWGLEDHPSLVSPGDDAPGNGLLLFFRVDDFGGRCGGHALSFGGSTRSRTGTPTLEPGSSRCETWTGTTSRSARFRRPS